MLPRMVGHHGTTSPPSFVFWNKLPEPRRGVQTRQGQTWTNKSARMLHGPPVGDLLFDGTILFVWMPKARFEYEKKQTGPSATKMVKKWSPKAYTLFLRQGQLATQAFRSLSGRLTLAQSAARACDLVVLVSTRLRQFWRSKPQVRWVRIPACPREADRPGGTFSTQGFEKVCSPASICLGILGNV